MSNEVEIVKFSVEDMLKIAPNLSDVARLNQQTGPAYTAIHEGKVVGCCGVRIDGIGEAWALYSDKAKKDLSLSMLKKTQEYLELIMRNHALYRLWSESPTSENENFIKHMDFRKLTAYLRG